MFSGQCYTDDNILIPKISYPKEFVYHNMVFTYKTYIISGTNKGIEKITNIENGTFYKQVTPFLNNNNILGTAYLFINGDKNITYYYKYDDNLLDSEFILKAQWIDKESQSFRWRYFSQSHCNNDSYGFGYFINNFDTKKGTEVGKTENGLIIYKINDDSILKTLYEKINMKVNPNTSTLEKNSYEEFRNSLSVITYKDFYDNWRILINYKYSSGGECW